MDKPEENITGRFGQDLDRLGSEQLRLEGRVYSLEKEMAMCMNILTIGLLVGGYFLYRWSTENMANTIPGVQA
jgi:hypothetical protein